MLTIWWWLSAINTSIVDDLRVDGSALGLEFPFHLWHKRRDDWNLLTPSTDGLQCEQKLIRKEAKGRGQLKIKISWINLVDKLVQKDQISHRMKKKIGHQLNMKYRFISPDKYLEQRSLVEWNKSNWHLHASELSRRIELNQQRNKSGKLVKCLKKARLGNSFWNILKALETWSSEVRLKIILEFFSNWQRFLLCLQHNFNITSTSLFLLLLVIYELCGFVNFFTDLLPFNC